MKYISNFILFVLLGVFLLIACNYQNDRDSDNKNEYVGDGFNFDYFRALDNESNEIEISVRSNYKLSSDQLKRFRKEYGMHYKDRLLLPIVKSISKSILIEYSPGDIYNYKRKEIEKKLEDRIKVELNSYKIEIEKLYINSVKLPDDLKERLEKEHNKGFKSINDCSNEIKGVITEIEHGQQPDDYIVNYKFIIDNKSYEGVLFPKDFVEKVSVGDSLIIEYSCENAIFHRIKKQIK